jgi:hypothetical protein
MPDAAEPNVPPIPAPISPMLLRLRDHAHQPVKKPSKRGRKSHKGLFAEQNGHI